MNSIISLKISNLLIARGADISTCGRDGAHEIYLAASGGHAILTKYLLDCGVDPLIPTDHGWTALHWASNNGYIECVQLLLNADANPSALSDRKKTPLDVINNRDDADRDIVKQLLLNAGGTTAAQLLGPNATRFDDGRGEEGDSFIWKQVRARRHKSKRRNNRLGSRPHSMSVQ